MRCRDKRRCTEISDPFLRCDRFRRPTPFPRDQSRLSFVRLLIGVPWTAKTRELKMPTLESVVQSDPDVLGGTPVFVGTRVPIKNLLDYLAAGDTLERFLDHFPSVTREQAVAALEIAKDLITSRARPAR